jgi:hypothetical protein
MILFLIEPAKVWARVAAKRSFHLANNPPILSGGGASTDHKVPRF